MQKFDLHMHTTYCDGKDSAEAMVLSAIDNGLLVAGISGHSFTPHDQSYCMSRLDTKKYIEEINALKQKYSGKITLLLGTELDRYADIDLSPYDYYIGSVHYIFSDEGKRKRDEILARRGGGAGKRNHEEISARRGEGAGQQAANEVITASDAEMEALIKFRDWCPVDDCAEDLCSFAFGKAGGSEDGTSKVHAGESSADKNHANQSEIYVGCEPDRSSRKTDPEWRKARMLEVAELYFDTVGGIIEATDCDIIGHFDLITKFTEGWGFGPDGNVIKKHFAETCGSPSGPDASDAETLAAPIFDTADERYVAAWKKAIDRIFDDCAERYKAGFRNRLEKLGVLEAGDKPVFEINTGAISKGYRTLPYPSADQIDYIKSKGGVLILSSDSHATGTICSGFEEFNCLF